MPMPNKYWNLVKWFQITLRKNFAETEFLDNEPKYSPRQLKMMHDSYGAMQKAHVSELQRLQKAIRRKNKLIKRLCEKSK